MSDFEVIYSNIVTLRTIRSKVYAVLQNNFLIADEDGKFLWVPMEYCRLPIDYAEEISSESHWDSADRWVEKGWRDD